MIDRHVAHTYAASIDIFVISPTSLYVRPLREVPVFVFGSYDRIGELTRPPSQASPTKWTDVDPSLNFTRTRDQRVSSVTGSATTGIGRKTLMCHRSCGCYSI